MYVLFRLFSIKNIVILVIDNISICNTCACSKSFYSWTFLLWYRDIW